MNWERGLLMRSMKNWNEKLSKFYVLLYNVVWRSVPFQWHTTDGAMLSDFVFHKVNIVGVLKGIMILVLKQISTLCLFLKMH